MNTYTYIICTDPATDISQGACPTDGITSVHDTKNALATRLFITPVKSKQRFFGIMAEQDIISYFTIIADIVT